MAEVNKQIQNMEKETVKRRQKFNNNNYNGGMTSKNVEYNMMVGTKISPCISFEHELKESNANIFNRNTRNSRYKFDDKIDRKYSINREIRNMNRQISFGYNFSNKRSSEFPLNWYEIPTPSNIDLNK